MTIDIKTLAILLIEDDPSVYGRVRDALFVSSSDMFTLEWVSELDQALDWLREKDFAAVILNLFLTDGSGSLILDGLIAAVPDMPILILGRDRNESFSTRLLTPGRHEYLDPDQLEAHLLTRALTKVIRRKSAEDAISSELENAFIALESIGDGVLCTDTSGCVTYLNPVAEFMTGWKREDARGRPSSEVFEIVNGFTREAARDPFEMALERDQTVGLSADCVLISRFGLELAIEDSTSPMRNRAGEVIGAVIVFRDVSASRAKSVEMTYSAHHDLVTDLPNRLLLNDRITQAISLAQRRSTPIAVMFMDLDHFKQINDSLGHAVGDKLLQSISLRLKTTLRGADTVSRQGGDEFVILLSDITDRDDASDSAKRVLKSLNAPHVIEGNALYISGSIGISMYPQDGGDPETLIQNADTAMYHAKEGGRDNFRFFASEMNLKAVKRQTLETSLRLALDRDEFVLNYQPRVDLRTNRITGCEALIRWHHPVLGIVTPDLFISVAEECGLIIPIGRWVLREACRLSSTWQKAGLPTVPIAVNVSAAEFRQQNFVDEVMTTLLETGLSARHLELELTERVLMNDVGSTAETLRGLKEIGIRLAVDDFGTGYSSLSYLRKFPIDVLKIDRSFVSQIIIDEDNTTLVTAIINMGRSLGHCVIAEGVETQHQKDYLTEQNCAQAQGYFFSRPLAATQFANLLQIGF